ncbi:MAG: chromate transporter [Chloroflexota bacterium]|nr:chromate transporter [Chloroflexota bacterium]
MNILSLFWQFLKAGLLSFGGLGSLPILVQSLVHDRGWATEAQIGQALAVGRISPGPNGLYVISLGYLIGGIGGAGVAAVANVIPSLLVLPLSALHRRVAQNPRVIGTMRMIGLAVVGILFWTAFSIVRGAATGIADWLIALAAPLIVILRPKWNPIFILLAAGIVGVALHY